MFFVRHCYTNYNYLNYKLIILIPSTSSMLIVSFTTKPTSVPEAGLFFIYIKNTVLP